jgi:hypothetical protein
MTYYQLNADDLKPGDVVLEAGAGKLPWLIRVFDNAGLSATGKVFYHVLIVVGSGTLMEATRRGVKEIGSGKIITRDPSDYIVLRHPSHPDGLRDSRFRTVGPNSFYYTLYSENHKKYDLMGAMLVCFAYFRELRRRPSYEYDAFFCSQLVAEAYRRVDVPIFWDIKNKEPIEPLHVTPNMFLSEEHCTLRRLRSEDVFVQLPDLAFNASRVRYSIDKDDAAIDAFEAMLELRVCKKFGPRVERLFMMNGKDKKIVVLRDIYEALSFPGPSELDAMSDEIVGMLSRLFTFKWHIVKIETYKKNIKYLEIMERTKEKRELLISQIKTSMSGFEEEIGFHEQLSTWAKRRKLPKPLQWRSIHDWAFTIEDDRFKLYLSLYDWCKHKRDDLEGEIATDS